MFAKMCQGSGIGIKLKADAPFDVFDSHSNFNGLISGRSGAGKSFLINHLAVAYLQKGYDIVIFDSGYSHAKLGKILGRHIDLNLDKPISINPFALVRNKFDLDEYLDSLKDFICGITNISADSKKYKFYADGIGQAIIDLWHIHKDKLELSHFIDKFNDNNFIDISNAIKAFNENYGDFFKSEPEIDFNNAYTVVEISNLNNAPILRDAIIFALYMHIFKKIHNKETKKTVCFMDEYQKYLNSDFIGGVIERAYRGFRRHDASIIVSIQGFDDIFMNGRINHQGRIILENSAWKIFFNQTKESINALRSMGIIKVNPHVLEDFVLLNNSHKPYYSVALLSTPTDKGNSIVKIKPADEFMYYVFSSSASDNAEINKHFPKGMDMKNATAVDVTSAIYKAVNKQ